MACPTCGATDARTQVAPGYWRCRALIDNGALLGAPALGRHGGATEHASGRRPCNTVYVQEPAAAAAPAPVDDPDATAVFAAVPEPTAHPLPPLPPRRPAPGPPAAARPPLPPLPTSRPLPPAPPDRCRCGAEPTATCEECSRPVCAEHSTLWRGWRVCDQDLAAGRMRAQAAAEEEERRVRAAAEAAKAERERLRNTLLELSPEDAFGLLYVQEPRTEQEVRSAVHVLRRVRTEDFTRLCLDVLPRLGRRTKGRRSGLRRRSGWPFAGEHYHDRSWLLTRAGTWYRSGSYGDAGAEQGYSGRKIRLDDTEKRAVIYDMAWQQERTGFVV